jgi:antitoxin FitA
MGQANPDTQALAFPQQTQHHGVMPVSITIRNVPTEVRNELAARAARSGQSLQEYLLATLVNLAGRPDVRTVIERARERVQRTGVGLTSEQILELLRPERE